MGSRPDYLRIVDADFVLPQPDAPDCGKASLADQDAVVSVLNEAVTAAKAGDVGRVALVMIHPDGKITTSYSLGDKDILLLGGLVHLQHRLNCDMVDDDTVVVESGDGGHE